MDWKVTRWSGRRNNEERTIFSGPEKEARDRYRQAVEDMRQGRVKLFGGDGDLILMTWSGNNRRHW